MVSMLAPSFVDRERRNLIRGSALLQLLLDVIDCGFELRILTLSHEIRPEIDVDIGIDTLILRNPLARLAVVNPKLGRGNRASVQQGRARRDADEATPSSLPNQRAELRLAEHPREEVAPRAGILVDHQDLRALHRGLIHRRLAM